MPITHKHEADIIADLIGQLQRHTRSAEMTLPDLEKLGAAYVAFAETFPHLANEIDGYADKAGYVLSAADIKSGGGGTWAQAHKRRVVEVEVILARRRT